MDRQDTTPQNDAVYNEDGYTILASPPGPANAVPLFGPCVQRSPCVRRRCGQTGECEDQVDASTAGVSLTRPDLAEACQPLEPQHLAWAGRGVKGCKRGQSPRRMADNSVARGGTLEIRNADVALRWPRCLGA